MSTSPARRSFVLAYALMCLGLASVTWAQESEPYPLEYWALRDAISNVSLSPEGDKLALMRIPSRDGDPIIEVYDTSDLTQDPFRIGADPMEIVGYDWVTNEDIAFAARQAVRDKIDDFNEGVFEFKFALVNLKTEKIRDFDQEESARVVNVLPYDKDHVIVAYENYDPDGPGARIRDAFRPEAYWKYNVKKGTRQLLIRGKLSLGAISFDPHGNPRIGGGFDERTGYYTWYYRSEDANSWEEIIRFHEDDWDFQSVAGIDEENPGHLFVYARNGRNTEGLWSFNVETKQYVEPVYHRKDVDVGGMTFHSNTWANSGIETGVVWYKDKRHVEYWDAEEEAIHRQLESVIPHAYNISFRRSRDGATILIRNSGPRDPGTYYLFKNGKIDPVGTRQPLIESEALADVRYITYESRDGRMIPGYITVPHGEPPYPLVVMPHGGPFIQEVVSYDDWGQMLANNGYLVLQPQYRGSLGYGLEFYQSAFINGGQGGYKMQDDKDDGALYLVQQGLVDPERIAMYGWSYGGYAALVAASRSPQIYQCVIAGAAVADPNEQVNHYRWESRGTQRIEQLNMWDDSVAPVKETAKVNVPLLLIHGSVDQRVPPKQYKLYRNALDKNEVPYTFVELEGADHFSNTLRYGHKLTLFRSMIDFLRNDCGDGGL